MRTQQRIRSCRQEPREYLFSYTIPDANQTVAGLAIQLDQDATFMLREVIPIGNTLYRYQFFDPARMPLQDSAVDPFDQIVEPNTLYPPAGAILITVEDVSGNPGAEVTLLFRGVNQYLDFREPPKEGTCLEVPKTYFLQVDFTANGQSFNNQLVFVDDDAEFALRQVIVGGDSGVIYQFADRDRSFVQSPPTTAFSGPGIYDPEIVYPPGGQIVVNAQGAIGRATFQFGGVNRYRVQ